MYFCISTKCISSQFCNVWLVWYQPITRTGLLCPLFRESNNSQYWCALNICKEPFLYYNSKIPSYWINDIRKSLLCWYAWFLNVVWKLPSQMLYSTLLTSFPASFHLSITSFWGKYVDWYISGSEMVLTKWFHLTRKKPKKTTQSYVYLQSRWGGFIWLLFCCHTSGPEDKKYRFGTSKSGTLWRSQREAAAAAAGEANVAKSQHGWRRNEQRPHVRPCCELCVMEQKKMSDASKALAVGARLQLCDISGCRESFGERLTQTSLCYSTLLSCRNHWQAAQSDRSAVRDKVFLKRRRSRKQEWIQYQHILLCENVKCKVWNGYKWLKQFIDLHIISTKDIENMSNVIWFQLRNVKYFASCLWYLEETIRKSSYLKVEADLGCNLIEMTQGHVKSGLIMLLFVAYTVHKIRHQQARAGYKDWGTANMVHGSVEV